MSLQTQHRWHFFRAGGLDQVQLRSADDLLHLGELDQTLWVALACPVRGLECDEVTLSLIDSDSDGRVRVPELIAAVNWACQRLRDPATLLKGSPDLTVADLIGPDLIAAAKRVLESCGEASSATINLRHLENRSAIFANSQANGDGIISIAQGMEAGLQSLITAVASCMGTTPDRSGKEGIDTARLDAFVLVAADRLKWFERGQSICNETGLSEEKLGIIQSIREKLSQWFHLCQLAAYDASLVQRPTAGDETKTLPLAQPDPKACLSPSTPIHPLWQAQIASLWNTILLPSGVTSLDQSAWNTLLKKADELLTWQQENVGAQVKTLGIQELQTILGDTISIAKLRDLMAQDLALTGQFAAIADLERLIRYHRDLALILRNFLCFADFYDTRRNAVFQAGTLYLDERRFDLCLNVEDPANHAGLASLGRCYLLYCACTRSGEARRYILAAVTQGNGAFLMPGRNGMFYDRKGRDWDATVVKVIEAPISIRQAFWSPYTALAKIIHEQLLKRLSGEQTEVEKNLESAAGSLTAPTVANVSKKPMDLGMFAIITVAFGAVSSIVLGFFAILAGMGAWLPLGVVGVILAISAPSCLIAAIKLRGRSLGPLLEASGWAINGRVRINLPLGIILTQEKRLPKGSITPLRDPFAERSLAWLWWLIFGTIVLVGLVLLGLWYWQVQPKDLMKWWQHTPTSIRCEK
jgi:hypothetical protein